MSQLLCESTSVAQPTAKDGRWRAVLITPGAGSSGVYSESMLKEYGPIALRKGAKSFVTHNRLENGEPDPFQMWGFLAEDSYYEDGVGLVGEIEVLPSWRDKVAEVAPHTALSVYVMGESDEAGNITKLIEDVQNGTDLVVHPGRPGSGLVEKLYESAIKDSVKADGDEASRRIRNTNKETHMDDATKALIESLVASVKTLGEKIDSVVALQEANSTAAADKVDALDTAAELTEAIAKAELPDAGRKRVFESVKAGTPVAEAVANETAYIADITKSLKVESSPAFAGRVNEGGAAGANFKIEGWTF